MKTDLQDLRLPWKRVPGGIKTTDGYWVMCDGSIDRSIIPCQKYMDTITVAVNALKPKKKAKSRRKHAIHD